MAGYLKKNNTNRQQVWGEPEQNNDIKLALPSYNQPLNYSSLETNKQSTITTPTSLSTPTSGSISTTKSGNVGFTAKSGNVGYTAKSSNLGYTGGTSNLGYTGGTSNLGYTGGTSNLGYTAKSGTVLGNSSQCPQNTSYLNNNSISNVGISQNLYCNSPIDSSLKGLINANLANMDANNNIVYKNLPTQSVSNNLPSTTIGIGSTGLRYTGYTGSNGSGFTGYTSNKVDIATQVAKSTSNYIAKKLQCNDVNQICIYESYEGITSIKSLQPLVDKQKSISKPVGKYQWIGADKSFNIGYNKITVAVVYSLTTQLSTATSFTLFASNSGYVFVNDVMYVIDNTSEIGVNNLYMLANILVPMGSKTNIDILLPANSAILINNNTLLNTNTEWKSKTYDLMNSTLQFSKIDPLDFAKENLNKKVISKKQSVYMIKGLTVSLNVTVDKSSSLISNSSTYKSYNDNDLKNDINIKSVVYSPVEDLYVKGINSSINFAIYGSNNFDVYIKSNNSLNKLTNSPVYNKVIVNSSITLKSISLTYKLAKGINHLYVVAPENTLIYIPYFKIDGTNDVFSNKELSKSSDYTDINKINITTKNWNYIFVNIPYTQFKYSTLYNSINNNFVVIEKYINYTGNSSNEKYKRIDDYQSMKELNQTNTLYNIIASSIKNIFSPASNKMPLLTSNRLEHFNDSENSEDSEDSYTLLEDKVIKHDYIVNSEKIREQIQNIVNNLNSDKQYNVDTIKKSYQDVLSNYDTIINSIKTKISNTTIKSNYNIVINDKNKSTLESIVNTEKNNQPIYNLINPVYIQYNTNYKAVVDTYNKINIDSSTLTTTIQNTKNNDAKILDDIYNNLVTQLTKLKSAIESDKYDDVKKEYDTYQIINKSLQDKLPSIRKTQTDYNINIGTLDTLISNLTAYTKTFSDYVSKTVTTTINSYNTNKTKFVNISKYLMDSGTCIA